MHNIWPISILPIDLISLSTHIVGRAKNKANTNYSRHARFHLQGLFGVGSGGDLSVRGERADSEPESGEVDPDDPRAIRDVVANPNVVCSPE